MAGFMVNGNPNTPPQLNYALMGYDSIEQLAPIKPQQGVPDVHAHLAVGKNHGLLCRLRLRPADVQDRYAGR